MNSKRVRLVAALVLVAACATPDSSAIAIVGVTVLPMDGSGELADRTIVIRDGMIDRIGPSGEVRVPADARRIEGAGLYAMPGLIDSHYHLYDPRDLDVLLAHGVTTILNEAGSPKHLDIRRQILAGERIGPTMYTTGPQLKDSPDPAIDTERSVTGVEDARRLVAEQARMGYDFVKPWSGFSDEVYDAIASEAARSGIRMLGHVPRSVGLGGVVAAGQSIAHIEEFYNKHFNQTIDDAGIPGAVSIIADGGVAVVSTLVTYDMIARTVSEDMGGLLTRPGRQLVDPVRQLLWEPQFNRYRADSFMEVGPDTYRAALAFEQRIALALHEAGVPLLAGTDAGMLPGIVPGEDLYRELELLVEAGLTPTAALQSATRLPGTFLEPESPFGTLVEGARADVLLLDENPLDDIANVSRVRAVVSRGRYFDREELDALLDGTAQAHAVTGRFVERVMTGGAASARAFVDSLRTAGVTAPPFDAMPVVVLAYAIAQQGDLPGAIDLLGIVMEVHPDEYWAPFMRARAYFATGNTDAARADYRRVLELWPGHPEAQRRLDALPGDPADADRR